jgi:hypothetical protein
LLEDGGTTNKDDLRKLAYAFFTLGDFLLTYEIPIAV